jgi:predicted glutamine amidotransferase
MCGIITAVNTTARGTSDIVLKAYEKQYARGSEGFGFVSIGKGGHVHKYARTQTFEGIRTALKKHEGRVMVFHHRFPTSTPNIRESNHPIRVAHKALKYDYYVIHNGVISNADERYKAHTALGFKYDTALAQGYRTRSGRWYVTDETEYNDSEALAIDLALYLEGISDKVHARGASAYVLMQVNKKTHKARRLYYGRNTGNPLYVARHKGVTVITSQDVTGRGVMVPVDIAHALDMRGHELETVALEVPTYSSMGYGYGSYLSQASMWDKYDENYRDKAPKKSDEQPAPALEKLPATTDTLDTVVDAIEELESERDMLLEDIGIAKQCLDFTRDASERMAYLTELDEYETRLEQVKKELEVVYQVAPQV